MFETELRHRDKFDRGKCFFSAAAQTIKEAPRVCKVRRIIRAIIGCKKQMFYQMLTTASRLFQLNWK